MVVNLLIESTSHKATVGFVVLITSDPLLLQRAIFAK